MAVFAYDAAKPVLFPLLTVPSTLPGVHGNGPLISPWATVPLSYWGLCPLGCGFARGDGLVALPLLPSFEPPGPLMSGL